VAKPPKHDAEYFPFYAKNGRTLKILQHRFKLTGIGFFTNVMRLLCTTPHHHLDLSEEVDRLVVYTDIGCEPEAAEAMIATMVMTGKLSRRLWEERRVLYCPDLVESLWELYEKRTTKPPSEADLEAQYCISGSETPVTGSETPQSGADTGVNVPVMPQRRGKERKGKKSTGEERAREDNFLPATEAHTTEVDTFEPPETDPVLDTYREGIEALGLPTTAWTNPGAQHVALKDIAERTKILAAQSPIPDPCDFARGILAVFKRRKETGKGDYWKNASPAPKVLQRRFDELVVGLGEEHERQQQEKRGMDALRRMGKL